MSFTWPIALAALVAAPLVVGAHLWQLRRRRRNAIRLANVTLVRAALPAPSKWRRHLPVGLLAAALVALGLAGARPTAAVKVPLSQSTIILALDVSRSMCNTDVAPNRLTVAQEAAKSFIRGQDDGTRIGLVAFSGFAGLVVPPTTDDEQLIAAIDRLQTSRGTAIGLATLASIDAIAEINSDVEPTTVEVAIDPAAASSSNEGDGGVGTIEYVPDIVVLLTDGANSAGVEPLVAIEAAVARRVRVYTIGFGTTEPQAMMCTPEQLGSGGFGGGGPTGGGGGGGRRRFGEIDVPTLQTMADVTGATFQMAENADQLQQVFDDLPSQVTLQTRTVELAVWFALVGAALAMLAIVLSARWHRSPA